MGTAQAQETTSNININHSFIDDTYGKLEEEGVYVLDDNILAVVEKSVTVFGNKRKMRIRALRELNTWKKWNDVSEVKQINEKYRGGVPGNNYERGRAAKLTMFFKIIE